MTAVHQFIPTFAPRGWAAFHTLAVRDVLRGMGLRSEIYAGNAAMEVARHSTPYRDFAGGEAGPTWLLYQASIGSPVAEWLVARPEPKLVNYHNITPASIFGPWEPHVGVELIAGRRQLRELAPVTELAIADSAYNEGELVAVGYRRTTVVPILLDTAELEHAVDQATVDRLRTESGDGAVWLFVSKVAPHKAQHDLIKAFFVYRRVYDPNARLRIVGGSSSHAYWTALEGFVLALQLDEAVELTGEVSDGELGAHYRAADVYVSMSEHEGFAIPLLEAMHHRVPIVAFGSSAVPETLGAGGLCLASKEPTTVAAAVHHVVRAPALRDALVAAGTRRLADFDLATNRQRFADAIQSVVGDGL